MWLIACFNRGDLSCISTKRSISLCAAVPMPEMTTARNPNCCKIALWGMALILDGSNLSAPACNFRLAGLEPVFGNNRGPNVSSN